MAYSSKRGRRPAEYASKSAHVHVINSDSVQRFLQGCRLPKQASEVRLDDRAVTVQEKLDANPIAHVIAVDGGYREIPIRDEFPSSTIAFFQFGVLTFKIRDLEEIGQQVFIDPEDMQKLKQMQRYELTLPVRNVALADETTLTHSIRRTMYNFFRYELEQGLATLAWFLFEEYRGGVSEWILASCPHCSAHSIPLQRNRMSSSYTFTCEKCQSEILLTDVFRLHEAIDDELGAGGIMGYVVTTIEQMLVVSVIRTILNMKPSVLQELLFIKDGPLAFFGQTANMHKPMRALVRYLFEQYDLFLAGLEKSGPFVEHADAIGAKLEPGQVLVLDNDYIYRYIIPGQANPDRPYGSTTYYGNKLIFKSWDERLYVITLPTVELTGNPKVEDLRNLSVVLANIAKLRCDMYDDALFPVALVNKLVSLADHPSARILTRFAQDTIPT